MCSKCGICVVIVVYVSTCNVDFCMVFVWQVCCVSGTCVVLSEWHMGSVCNIAVVCVVCVWYVCGACMECVCVFHAWDFVCVCVCYMHIMCSKLWRIFVHCICGVCMI